MRLKNMIPKVSGHRFVLLTISSPDPVIGNIYKIFLWGGDQQYLYLDNARQGKTDHISNIYSRPSSRISWVLCDIEPEFSPACTNTAKLGACRDE